MGDSKAEQTHYVQKREGNNTMAWQPTENELQEFLAASQAVYNDAIPERVNDFDTPGFGI